MYKIDWDVENNLLVLKKENAFLSNEYRPVFSAELKNLGFDSYFTFDESRTAPVLWAIRNHYYYKGNKIAELIDNGCLKSPSIRILDECILGRHLPLIDVGLWFRKNRALMDQLVQDSLLRIYRVYMDWKDRVDYIHVAYSSGKDSAVLLDLVKRVVPHDRFFVSWIDSGMELRSTVETVRREMARCDAEGIRFFANHTILDPVEAWTKIGPPSFDNRWCCSVLRSVPQIIREKEYLGKEDAKGLVFLGNRADESSNRMRSSLVDDGVKHKSQADANGIINWNSLEVFLYLLMNGIDFNPAYKEGYLRIGCLLCPRANTLSLGFAYSVNREELEPYYDVVRATYRNGFDSEEALEQYINLGDWRRRKGSKNTKYHVDYREYLKDGMLHLEMKHPMTAWETWIRTLGIIRSAQDLPAAEASDTYRPHRTQVTTRYLLARGGKEYVFEVKKDGELLDVSLPEDYDENFTALFKKVFQKALTCFGCRTCEVNCPHGHMHFVDGQPVLDDGCLHCGECHNNIHSCFAFDSWFKTDQVL